MKKLLIGLSAIAILGNVSAGNDDWRLLGHQPDDDGSAFIAVYGNFSSYDAENHKGWVRIEILKGSLKGESNLRYMVGDCKNQKVRTLHGMWYTAAGAERDVLQADGHWMTVYDDETSAQAVAFRNFLCRK